MATIRFGGSQLNMRDYTVMTGDVWSPPRLVRVTVEMEDYEGRRKTVLVAGSEVRGAGIVETDANGWQVYTLRSADTDADVVKILDEKAERKVLKWLKKKGLV
jgi:hypothetical protein